MKKPKFGQKVPKFFCENRKPIKITLEISKLNKYSDEKYLGQSHDYNCVSIDTKYC